MVLTNQNEDNKSSTDRMIRLVCEVLVSTGTLTVLLPLLLNRCFLIPRLPCLPLFGCRGVMARMF